MQQKNTNKKAFFSPLFIFLLTVAIFLFFGKIEKTHAADAGATTPSTEGEPFGICHKIISIWQPSSVIENEYKRTKKQCEEMCKENGWECEWKDMSTWGKALTSPVEKINPGKDICSNDDWFSRNFFKCILLAILRVLVSLLSVAVTIFEYIVKPANFLAVVDAKNSDGASIIYTLWKLVRDTFNIAFILTLLFSAFCTVFQVEKYNYKNILKNLVIMALLVNFSFPLARFIIDFSNVLMYYIFNNLFTGINGPNGVAIFSTIGNNDHGGLAKLLNIGVGEDISYILATIVFVFMFTITILTIAILLMIRAITLAILVIFSPIGFVGTIVPFFAKHSNEWWDNLFKHSFFGPIIAFMLFVSVEMMSAINKMGTPEFKTIASSQTDSSDFVVSLSLLAIPIIILWIAIGFAQKSSLAGASMIVGQGQKFMKWGAMTFTGAKLATDTWKSYRKRRDESGKDALSNRIGTWVGSRQDQLRGTLPGRGGRDATNRYERDLATKVKQESERRDMTNMAPGDLQELSQTGNRFEQAAAIQELANKGQATAAQLATVRGSFGKNSQVSNQIAGKMKSYNPVAAFATNINANGDVLSFDKNRLLEYMNSNQFDAKKVNADTLGNSEFIELAFQKQAISNKDLEDLRGKSNEHKNNIINSLKAIAVNASDITSPIHKNIQMAHFAQTGNIQNSSFTESIFQEMNKDNAKRMSEETAKNINTYQLMQNVNAGKYKDIILNMDNRNAQRIINQSVRNANVQNRGPQAQAVKNIASTDAALKNI